DLGQRAIDFFGFLKHSKGEWAGQVFNLEPWQQFILWCLFGWVREDGTRRYRVAYIELPRKNGKTTLSAGVGLYLFMADNEPGAEVYSAATKRDQARICHSEAVRMVKASSHLAAMIGVFRDNLHIVDTACKFEPLGADADSMDGLNIHASVVDELHAHKTRKMWDVIDTATGSRRQPMIFAITTAGSHGETICWEQHEYTLNVLDGIFEDDSHFGFVAHLDKDADWTDPKEWAKANPNYGISVKVDDLARKCEKAKRVPSYQNSFMRLHLNVWTQQESRWLMMDDWDECPAKSNSNLLRGRECYVGLDLANTIDVAAACLLFPPEEKDGVWRSLLRFWIPEQRILEKVQRDRVPYDAWVRDGWVQATEGNVIDYDFIREDLNQLADEFEFKEIGADPWNATQITTQLAGDGHTVVPVRQGYFSLSSPTKYMEGLVVSHKFDHGGNPVLRWMASNVAVMSDPAGNIKPAKDKSGEKIDGIAATVIALARALVHEGDQDSIYDSTELLVV
ncbi:MAG: terminase large subunit, partial [Gammaproteobacteria bacterium]|nr:terminase large subunit [Gammaproteobacteria bacterium]